MPIKFPEIERNALVSDIVNNDYRTAEVFRKYNIGYCCTGKMPLEVVCNMEGIDVEMIRKELSEAVRTVIISNRLQFEEWSIDFLLEYITNVHHEYLKISLKEIAQQLKEYTDSHKKVADWMPSLEKQFLLMKKQLLHEMSREEETLFPYIRQISYAYRHKEPYAALFVKTLRKPIDDDAFTGHSFILKSLSAIRELSGQYAIPANACVARKVLLKKLAELDRDIVQHFYLEQNILFPRAKSIEKELLSDK